VSKQIEPIDNVTVHMMVRNEHPTAFFALLSVLPAVQHAIVVDTGSDDGTFEALMSVKEAFPDKDIVLVQMDDIPDSTDWAFGRYTDPNKQLGQVRKWMAEHTATDYFWIVDGDEVYRDAALPYIQDFFRNWPAGVKVGFVPLLWFGVDIHHIAITDPATYPVTGRLFLRDGMHIVGTFPGEMAAYDGAIIGPDTPGALILQQLPPFHHYEMVTKPWRRRLLSKTPYYGPQPDVFARYGIAEKTGA